MGDNRTVTSGGPLREVLNRLRWNAGEMAGGAVITYREREGGDKRDGQVAFAEVAEILPRGVNLADGTYLPYHRVVAVRRGTEVLWHSRRR